MTAMYNAPIGDAQGNNVVASDMGSQIRTDAYIKKALIEMRQDQYFMPLADVTAMPKHFGKKAKLYHYLPLLHDENVNSQGLDAAGATIADGNLYGSSKDVGTIPGKLPLLREEGGQVNRVGFTRKEIEGTLERFGFYEAYTEESVLFDTDAELRMHVNREMLNGASEITEDALQIDLLNAAQTVRLAGGVNTVGELNSATLLTYDEIVRLSIDLDNVRTPKQTKIITGTRYIDTKTINAARVAYCSSDLTPTLKDLQDNHGNQAFISVEKYAAAGNTVNGEIGAIDQLRIVTPLEMMKWEGAGDTGAIADGTCHRTGDNYDVYPLMVVGDGSFSTIGFQTDGKTVKFKIKHSKPGSPESYANDPYGQKGFMSIMWYYGFLALRPERIGIIKCAAKL
jgi:N4-gp56 family major capsid protein